MFDPAKHDSIKDLPRHKRLVSRPEILHLLEEPEQRGLAGDQVRTLQDFFKAGPTQEHVAQAREGHLIVDPCKNRKSISSLKQFEYRKELPHFEELMDALLARDKTAQQTEKQLVRRGKRRRQAAFAGSLAETKLQELCRQLPTCTGKEQYTRYLRESCTLPEVVAIVYDDHYQVLEVLLDRYVEGSRQFNVKWQANKVRNEHVDILTSETLGYKIQERLPLSGQEEGWCEVIWENSWEPEECITQHDHGRALVEEFEANKKGQSQIKQWVRKDNHLSNMDRQGHWPALADRPALPLALEPELQEYIDINPFVAVNPDKDIAATGNFEILLSNSNSKLIDILLPNGHYAGTLTRRRAAILARAVEDSKAYASLAPTQQELARHLAELLCRYRDGFQTQEQRTTLKNHWATPDIYMQALQRGLSIDIERFASPLNFTPGMRAYYSLYEEDQVFGANHNAFSCKWTGASQCNPEYEAVDMDKAVRWAIASAHQTEEASLTAFVLPYWNTTAYMRHLDHPLVHTLARIPKAQFKFKRPDHWRREDMYLGHPKWDVLIFLVANAAGIQEYVKPIELQREFSRASRQIGGRGITVTVPTLTRETDREDVTWLPKAFRSKELLPCRPMPWATKRGEDPQCFATIRNANELPMRWRAKEMWYTDGSVIRTDGRQRIGAGVFCESEGVATRVNCGAQGPTNTINRAEMCALHCCMQKAGLRNDVIVASDSQVSMCWLNWDIRAPVTNCENKHRVLVNATANLILERARAGLSTQIVKVKSHTGIHGNDRADQLAKEATDHERYSCDHQVMLGQDAFEGLCWPSRNSKGDNGQERWLAGNLNGALTEAARPRLQTGRTNKTQYTTWWDDMLPELNTHASNRFWDIKSVPQATIRQTLKIRYGQVWSMRTAYKCKMPYFRGGRILDHYRCPLCGRNDSTSHMLGECGDKDMQALYIKRHDEAGRIGIAAILKGGHGNHLVCADLGCQAKVEHLSIKSNRIPDSVISDTTLTKHGIALGHRHKIRPDALYVECPQMQISKDNKRRADGRLKINRTVYDPKSKPPWRKSKAIILEIGYGSETRYHEKSSEKSQQHATLQKMLETEGFEAEIRPIILGTAGGIFRSSDQAWRELGLDKESVRKLNDKLHVHAITTAHEIIKLRRAKERFIQKPHQQRKKKPPDK